MTHNITKIATVAALVALSTAELVNLNDWAVNTIRAYARERGYDANELFNAEAALIRRHSLDMEDYRTFRRVGMKMRLTRQVRRAVWIALESRVICNERFSAA